MLRSTAAVLVLTALRGPRVAACRAVSQSRVNSRQVVATSNAGGLAANSRARSRGEPAHGGNGDHAHQNAFAVEADASQDFGKCCKGSDGQGQPRDVGVDAGRSGQAVRASTGCHPRGKISKRVGLQCTSKRRRKPRWRRRTRKRRRESNAAGGSRPVRAMHLQSQHDSRPQPAAAPAPPAAQAPASSSPN